MNIPLIGIRKYEHHFLKSILQRGTSLNLKSCFFLNHSMNRKKVEDVVFAFLFSTRGWGARSAALSGRRWFGLHSLNK